MRYALIALVLLGSLGFAALPETTSSEPASFRVDPVHSSVLFKVKHSGVSWFYGRFDTVAGSFTVDAEEPGNCTLEIEVDASSVNTRNEKLDGHLRSGDFLDTEEHPKITFSSTKVEAGEEEGTYKITGDLTLRGKTKEITVEADHVGTAEGRRGVVTGYHVVFSIDRTDFDVSYGAGGPLGSEVELIVSVEARKR